MPRNITREATRTRRDRDEDERDRYEEEEEYAASRHSRRRDLDDDEPRSSRRSSRDEDERPRHSLDRHIQARSRRDEDEDDRSSRRSTSRRSSRDEDSGDSRETRRASRSEGAREATSTSIGKGRASVRKHNESRASSGDFAGRLKVEEKTEHLLKVLDRDFFITYYEHNLYDDFKGEKVDGKQRQFTFICLGDNCPLCEWGHKPSYYALVNVVDLTDPRKPELKVWYASSNPAGKLSDLMDSEEDKDRSIDHPDVYVVVSKKKQKNNFFDYTVKSVKARDLEEDYDTTPLDDSELADFLEKAWTEDIVRINKRSDLLDIADELAERAE